MLLTNYLMHSVIVTLVFCRFVVGLAGSGLVLTDDPESIAEGERLSRIRGCIGCHGNLEGQVFFDQLMLARIVAPNLTQLVRRYTLPELDAIIRHGIYPDGRGTMAMPSSTMHDLSDEDLGATLAFLRSVEPMSSDLPSDRKRVGMHAMFALGH